MRRALGARGKAITIAGSHGRGDEHSRTAVGVAEARPFPWRIGTLERLKVSRYEPWTRMVRYDFATRNLSDAQTRREHARGARDARGARGTSRWCLAREARRHEVITKSEPLLRQA